MDAATFHFMGPQGVPIRLRDAVRSQGEVLRLADGIELIGKFEGSGFKDPPLLARRADGQVVQLTKLLYEVAAAADGRHDAQAVGQMVSRRCGRPVAASDVAFLADRKLRPLGILALADGTTPVLAKCPPVMALRHRKPLLSERAVNAGASIFTWLHMPFVQAVVLLTVAAFDVWLFLVHGIAGGLRSALYDPVLLLAVFASVVIATAFHEFGHASACRYGGARPGAMGVGLYLVWPVFYCDVTDAYRLNRAGRLRTDLGGIYFNAIFALFAGGVFLLTGEQAALLAAFLQHLLILQQLIPLMRFDGYYVLTDLTGVPDILSRVKPILRSLMPGREHEPRVAELKPWVRWVATIYLVALVPALVLLFAWMIIGTPRVVATMYRAFVLQLDSIGRAGAAEIAVGAVRTTMLALQLGGMALSMARVGQMARRPLLRWAQGSIPRTGATALAAAALVGAAAYAWWPHGDYRPIQPGERGTVQDGLNSLIKLARGLHVGTHPAWTGGEARGASGTVSANGTASGGGTRGRWTTTAGATSRASGARASGGAAAPTPGSTISTGTGTTTTTTFVPGSGPTDTPSGPPTAGTGTATSPSTTGGAGTTTSTTPTTTSPSTTTSPTTTTTTGTSTTTSPTTTTTTGASTTTSPTTTTGTPPSTTTGATPASTPGTTTTPSAP
jgi:putative peptide zinc metalloprotease protein